MHKHHYLPILKIKKFKDSILKQRWFKKTHQEISLLKLQNLPVQTQNGALWTYIHVEQNKKSSIYRFPVVEKAKLKDIPTDEALSFQDQEGNTWVDALFCPSFRNWLLNVALTSPHTCPNTYRQTALKVIQQNIDSPSQIWNGTSTLNQKDQTNSCIFYGDLYFLKFYRKVEFGENHECKVLRAINHPINEEKKHTQLTPRFIAEIQEPGIPSSTAYELHQLIHPSKNLWQHCLDLLDSISLEKLVTQHESEISWMHLHKLSTQVGHATRHLHARLQSLASFPPIKNQVMTFPLDELGDLGTLLENIQFPLFNTKEIQIQLQKFTAHRPLQLIHGDLHLGQILKRNDQLFFTDFDNEPLRQSSALKSRGYGTIEDDLASMIRSWEYLIDYQWSGKALPSQLRELKDSLIQCFLSGYQASQTQGDTATDPIYLQFACLAKSLREYAYEITYRPAWAHIPLQGIIDYSQKISTRKLEY